MKFFNRKLVTYLSSLLLILVVLVACNQTNKVNSEVIGDSDTSALFSINDLNNALATTISESIELPSVDLNNEEINIEGDPAPEENDAELTSQAILPNVTGYLAYYRVNTAGTTYQIWIADQATDIKTKVYSSSFAVQSVAVSGDGNWVAASIINSSGKYDIYLFDVAGGVMYQLTNSANKDDLDVSMTADGSKIVYSSPTNAGLSKIRICDYDSTTNTCTISTLGASKNQRQASITGNGEYIVLVRDLNPGVRWRVVLYNVATNTYTIVVTRIEQLSDPSANHDGTLVMYLRDRTSTIGKHIVRIKNLVTNVINNELSKPAPAVDHPHIVPMADYFTYRDIANGRYRAFTRNIATNQRASAQGGTWDYYQPYWQVPVPAVPVLPILGLWDTTFGEMEFLSDGTGTYTSDNGRLQFSLDGTVLTGYWIEDSSSQDCGVLLDGSVHWGQIEFTFDPSFTSFTGLWGYCTGTLPYSWDGTRQ